MGWDDFREAGTPYCTVLRLLEKRAKNIENSVAYCGHTSFAKEEIRTGDFGLYCTVFVC